MLVIKQLKWDGNRDLRFDLSEADNDGVIKLVKDNLDQYETVGEVNGEGILDNVLNEAFDTVIPNVRGCMIGDIFEVHGVSFVAVKYGFDRLEK